tara:strand:+ start:185 stop:742 length:558 start_codon:yes stop_codon:yes gene_type:complete
LRQGLEVKKYISFEPIKKLYQDLSNEFGNYLQFEVINIGLSSVKDFKNINVNHISSTSTLSEINNSKLKYKIKNLLGNLSGSEQQKSELIEVDLLDNLELEIRNYVDLVIIDVEGHELEVLKGAFMFFKKNIPKYIVVEIQKKENYKNYDPEKIKNHIETLGYKELKTLRGPLYLFTDIIFKYEK